MSQMECEADLDSQRSFLDACKKGNAAKVKLLIDRGADTEAKDESGRTPLHLACGQGHVGVVKLFIEKIPSTIQIAFEQGRLDVVKDVLADTPEVSKKMYFINFLSNNNS